MKQNKFLRSGPHLPVKNLQLTLAYYRNTLGFYEEWTWPDKNGELKDGGVRRDGMRLLFGEDLDYTNLLNTDKNRLVLLWFVQNVEDVLSEFLNNGVDIAAPIQAHSYGLKEFAFIDINGYYIRVAEETGQE